MKILLWIQNCIKLSKTKKKFSSIDKIAKNWLKLKEVQEIFSNLLSYLASHSEIDINNENPLGHSLIHIIKILIDLEAHALIKTWFDSFFKIKGNVFSDTIIHQLQAASSLIFSLKDKN